MRLRTLFLVYLLTTAATVAAPFAIQAFDRAHRRAMPVNSEAPLEAAPTVAPVANSGDPTFALPACVATDGTEYYGDRGTFYADGQTGIKRYFYNESPNNFFRSCAVRPDGVVYALSSGPRDASMRAYSPEGDLRWSVTIPGVFSRLAISRSGIAYLVARPWNGISALTAYRPDGTSLWQMPIGNPEAQGAAISPAIGPDGTIYAVSDGQAGSELMAIAPEGRKLWTTSVSGHVSEFIVGPNGGTFLKVPTGHLIAFDSRGQKLWEFYSGNFGIDGGIALAADGTLYFASRFLYALDAAGKTKWTFKSEATYTDGDYFDRQPVVADDGTVYAVSYRQQLYAITPDGRKKWHPGPDPPGIRTFWNQIILAGNGTLIASSGRMQVSSGLAKTGWPAANHDNANRRSQEPIP